MLPATISNNVPGTDLSIGADTALNAIVEVRGKKKLLPFCKGAILRKQHHYNPVTLLLEFVYNLFYITQ